MNRFKLLVIGDSVSEEKTTKWVKCLAFPTGAWVQDGKTPFVGILNNELTGWWSW